MKNKMIVIMLSALLLCGCSSDIDSVSTQDTTRFVTLEEYFSGDVIVDTKTGVEYWRSDGSYNHGTLTLLVDADGKPLICEEYKD